MSKVSASLRHTPPPAERTETPALGHGRQDFASSPTAAAQWALPLALLFSVFFWIAAWHGPAVLGMVGTWWRSETFAHGLIIYPTAAWLIWRKRRELSGLPLRPCFWGLLPLAGAASVGLLGELAGVEAARQFAVVSMLPLAVVVVFGTAIARTIAFPLAFTLLAVPVGEFLLPTLMQLTADFTVAALRLSGIPVYREGLFFTVPSGRWSVVEACSGLRYLIASLTLGMLYAYLSYRSLGRRLLFIAASIFVPIVANWVRAYMIVMIGHLTDMRYAVGVDHLIYGWVFFGVVMLLLFWVGSWWREDEIGPAEARRGHAGDVRERPGASSYQGSASGTTSTTASLLLAALAVAVIASAGPGFAAYLEAREGGSDPVLAPPALRADWKTASGAGAFAPHFLNSRASLHQEFESQAERVGLFVAYYAQQGEGRELIGYGNGLVKPGDMSWIVVSQSRRAAEVDALQVNASELRSAQERLVVWHWYWVGGRWVARPEEVKLRQAFQRLLGRGDDAAVVVVYTRTTDSSKHEGERVLQRFVAAMEPSIKAVIENARSGTSQQSVLKLPARAVP